ncbi:MAG: CsbD family protein [Armatimonadetes bacterium]|nr:CsbD family protein [Armatimonadota bacterium]
MANREKVEGEYDQAKGHVKQAAGDVLDNEQLQAEGTWDRVKGSVKEGVGEIKDAVQDANKR